jgi:formate dehydrogenase iron-sulfur subunit
MCSTKALLAGDGDVISDIFRNRVTNRQRNGKAAGGDVFGWGTAYSKPQASTKAEAPKAEKK